MTGAENDDKVGHLNTILARGGGNLNDPTFKSSNARGLPGRGGCWSFELIGALFFRFTAFTAESAMPLISDVVNKIMQISGEMNIYGAIQPDLHVIRSCSQ